MHDQIKNQNVIIVSHPRSGSYWFQECLPHYDMNELFNVSNIPLIKLGADKVVCSNYTSKNLTVAELTKEYTNRASMFNSVNKIKSVKIHHHQLIDNWIFDWIVSQQSAKIIFFERRDKSTAFYSLLISNALKKFKGKHTTDSVYIDPESIEECYNSIFVVPANVGKIKNAEHYYYEDVLTSNIRWLDKSKPTITKQDTVTNVKIINREELDNFINKTYDISARRIF